MSIFPSLFRSTAPSLATASTPRPAFLRLFLPLFLALALAVTLCSREQFFRTAFYEEGDDAANGLQINRAKHFQELHGNYSRWGFHHPGPAFFYVYALGEFVFYDVTHVAPAPRNAHIYAGTLLQLAFYATALALLARQSRQPLLVIALALALGALHYQHVPRVLYSVWPPDVLLMPFLCFVVACAAVAVGDKVALPVLVIAGSFLVHGHIAQPLFVLPMTLLAIGWAWRRSWRGQLGEIVRSAPGITALSLLAIFLLPLVLDLFAGRNSNFHDVLLHLRYQSDAGKTLFKSVLCYGASFIGLDDPTMFNKLSDTTHVPFVEHAWLLAGWLTLLGISAWWFFRGTADRETRNDLRFGRCLCYFWLMASALTLVWGMRQDGGFTNFNSRFNHSLVHVIALLGISALASVPRKVPRLVTWCALPAGVAAFTLALPFVHDVGTRASELTVKLRGLLLADPKPAAPKLITFDSGDWYEAVTLARALQRLDIPFFVHPASRVMFGDDKVLCRPEDIATSASISEWHVVAKNHAPHGAHVLNRECSLVFPQAAPLPALPTRIDFTANQHMPYAMFGIGQSDADWAWTDARVAVLHFVAARTTLDLELTLDAEGMTNVVTPNGQRVNLFVNGQLVGRETFKDERHAARFAVSREVWNRASPQMIVLELPDAIAPATFGGSGDRRLLALRLHALSLTPVGAK